MTLDSLGVRLSDLWKTSVDDAGPRRDVVGLPKKGAILYMRLSNSSPDNLAIRDLLASRPDLSLPSAAKEFLVEYILLMRDALLDLEFTADEASVIVSALHYATLSRATYYLVYEMVNEYIGRVQPGGVDREVLVAKIRQLDFLHTAALVDAARRYWTRTKHDIPMKEYLVECGLVRE